MHVRLPLLAAVLGAAGSPLAQEPVDFRAWLQQRYPEYARANVADATAAARQQGLLRAPGDLLLLKRAFHELRVRKGGGASGVPVLRDAPPGPRLFDASDNIVNEVEFNDGAEFATPMAAAACARGDCSIADDVDVYTFVSAGEFITAEVQAQGGNPIVDSMLGIKTMGGQMIAFSEDISGSNFLSRISVYLPVGFYQMEIGPWNSTGGGTYDIVMQRDPAALTPLAVGTNSGTTAPPGGGTQTVWTFALATDATVRLQVTPSQPGADLALAVQLADGRLWFLNDDSSAGLDPSADIDLPAGSYSVHVTDLGGGAVPYTIGYAETPIVLADLCFAGLQQGSIIGEESRRLYRLTNPTMGDVDLQTAGGVQPIGDTIVYLFDSDLDYLCDVDDANIQNASDYYSRMQIGLPAGAYFVAVRGWNTSSGDYTLTPTCGLPFPTTGAVGYGRNLVPVPGGGRVSLSAVEICSTNSVRLDSSGGFSGSRTIYNFMTGNGESLGVMEWVPDTTRTGQSGRSPTRPTVGTLPRGTQYALTWNRFEDPSANFFLDVRPPLHCDGGSLTSHGKQGDLVLLFGDLASGPGVSFAGLGLDGFFCLAFPSPTVTVGIAFYPASGAVNWLTCPAITYGVFLQHGDLFAVPGPFLGVWRDRRRL